MTQPSGSLGTVQFKLRNNTECTQVKEVVSNATLQMGSHRNTQSPQRKATDIYANLERITKAKSRAEQAIKERKVFRLDGGHRYVRQALKSRGWVEKFTSKTKRFATGEKDADDEKDDNMLDQEKVPHLPLDDFDQLVSRALRDHEPDLQFVPLHRIDFNSLNKDIILNHFPKASFVTKTGLTSCLQHVSWVSDRHSEDFYPRCFILGDAEDNEAFRNHFRRCAVTSFLKICAEQLMSSIDEEDPTLKTVDSEWISFALEMYNTHYNDNCAHSTSSTIMRQISLDEETPESKKQWTNFIQQFYNIAYKGYFVHGVRVFENLINETLKQYEENNPQAFIEGSQNLWIIKPGAMSRGRGIGVYNNLKQIIDLLGPDLSVIANNKWVAQKYIERPLLIHGVKFDIRQWFVVTDWAQLSIWMYQRSYVRFSTTRFTLDRLDTQTHLTNNAIQKNFDLEDDLHEDIPQEKMWFSEDLDAYLKNCGYGNVWQKKIVPAMQRILIETCLAGQDTAESRKNSFEIYGADFMLDEQLKPWLIEINQGPTMATSTTVSNELVQSLIEDLCKVVLDRKRSPQGRRGSKPTTPDTGDFELVYRQSPVECPRYVGNSLNVEGRGLIKPKVRQRTFIKTIVPKSPTAAIDSETPPEALTRVYSWDIDRINRLAQPRNTVERPPRQQKSEPAQSKPPTNKVRASPSRVSAPQASTSKLSPSTQNILKKLKEISNKTDCQRMEFNSSTKNTEGENIPRSKHKKVGQPTSAREHKIKIVPRPITSKSQHEERDIIDSKIFSPEEATSWEKVNRKIEISKQIEADLQLARKRCETMIKPVRSNEKPLEHRLLYPLGLTESRFKIQPRTKTLGKSSTNVNASLRAYRQMKDLPNLQMLAHSKVMQTRVSPSKVSLSPTVYPFIDGGLPSMQIGDKSPRPLPIIMPLSAVLDVNRKSHLVLSGNVNPPKHVRQGVPNQRIEKNPTEQYCIKIPL